MDQVNEYFLWHCSQVNVRQPYQWHVNFGRRYFKYVLIMVWHYFPGLPQGYKRNENDSYGSTCHGGKESCWIYVPIAKVRKHITALVVNYGISKKTVLEIP